MHTNFDDYMSAESYTGGSSDDERVTTMVCKAACRLDGSLGLYGEVCTCWPRVLLQLMMLQKTSKWRMQFHGGGDAHNLQIQIG